MKKVADINNRQLSSSFAFSALGNRHGVTLVELLVVIGIIGIIAALAAPEFADYRTTINANRAASDILSDMQLARTGAIFNNKQYRLRFSTALNSDGVYWYDIYRMGFEPGDTWVFVKENGLPSGIEYNLDGTETGPIGLGTDTDGITFADNQIIFQNVGSANTGFVYFMPKKDKSDSRKDRMRALRIEFAPTAKVKSYRHDGTAWKDF